MFLGVIADDFTGATDIAGFLVENGLRTVQLNGTPATDETVSADAVVISLKSRSCPVEEAITQSLTALRWLQAQGCQQFYFKYCSTFDSTSQGNIGPVTDALLNALGESFTLVCPALPVNGRTVFNGHLFVLGEPLHESGMRHHPVTPMTDSSLLRLMDKQSAGKTGLVNYEVIEKGVTAVEARFAQLKAEGVSYAVVDALSSAHLETIGKAVSSFRLLTGGSGLAAGLAKNWAPYLKDQASSKAEGMPKPAKGVVLSGSCSVMTNKQVAEYARLAPSYCIDVAACIAEDDYPQQVAKWVGEHSHSALAPMVYATAEPEVLRANQERFGAAAVSHAVETFFGKLAQLLRASGVKNFIVAGGETSGIVTQHLGVYGFHIGPQIAPGVPWVKGINSDISLALKSGNFGDVDFFSKAQSAFDLVKEVTHA